MSKTTSLKGVMREKDYGVSAKDAIPGGTRDNLTPERKIKMSIKDRTEVLNNIFPDVDCGETAIGAYIIIQKLKIPKEVRRGGIIRTIDAQDADRATVSVAKVVSIGPLAFISDVNGKHKYPGGVSPYKVGDLVRVPKMGGQHLNVDDVDFYYLFDDDVRGVISDLDRVASLY